jgi:SNF2 family DNA or RNA helicase
VPGNNEQAEDRAFRIGQKNNVNVYYQLFDDTITRIWNY